MTSLQLQSYRLAFLVNLHSFYGTGRMSERLVT